MTLSPSIAMASARPDGAADGSKRKLRRRAWLKFDRPPDRIGLGAPMLSHGETLRSLRKVAWYCFSRTGLCTSDGPDHGSCTSQQPLERARRPSLGGLRTGGHATQRPPYHKIPRRQGATVPQSAVSGDRSSAIRPRHSWSDRKPTGPGAPGLPGIRRPDQPLC